MNNDELQVLGKPHKPSKWEKTGKVFIAIAVVGALLSLGTLLHSVFADNTSDEHRESTIIPELQQAVDSLLTGELKEIWGLHGQVIVMRVQTGEIVAMVGKERRFDKKYQVCQNLTYRQEPGTTMMTAALLALLETGEVKMTDMVNTGHGVWPMEGLDMKDHNWRRGGYGEITLEHALEVSSNIGISRAIQKAFKGKEFRYYELLDKMSFGQPEQIDGIEGLLPQRFSSPKDSTWASYMLPWNSIGYERLLAPIQMLTFYNAIANDGKMVKPTLYSDSIEVINPQIASKESITQMRIALEHVVSHGLGKKANTDLVAVAGKTGTAQVFNAEQEDDEFVIANEYHLSFCGYFPADAPEYSMMVSLNKEGIPASGGGMAGVLFHNIVEWMIAHDMLHNIIID